MSDTICPLIHYWFVINLIIKLWCKYGSVISVLHLDVVRFPVISTHFQTILRTIISHHICKLVKGSRVRIRLHFSPHCLFSHHLGKFCYSKEFCKWKEILCKFSFECNREGSRFFWEGSPYNFVNQGYYGQVYGQDDLLFVYLFVSVSGFGWGVCLFWFCLFV